MKPVIYVNLSTGAEVLEGISTLYPNHEVHFSHLQSTHLEQSNYRAFLHSVDNDMLMRMALGIPFIFIDYGSRSKDGIPRTIFQGIPFLQYVCANKWFNISTVDELDPKYYHIKDYNAKELFRKVYKEIFVNSNTRDNLLCKKFKYFRQFVDSDLKYFGISTQSAPSKYDGKYEDLINIIHKFSRIPS